MSDDAQAGPAMDQPPAIRRGADHTAADQSPGGGSRVAQDDAARRRRRDRVFGDVLPESTRDDLAAEERSVDPDRAAEERLRGQVPPHHG